MTTGSNNCNSRTETSNDSGASTTPRDKTSHNFIPEEDLLAAIHRLAEANGESPSVNKMNREGKYSAATYQRRFGSWSQAIETAGLQSRQPREQITISKDEITEAIQELANHLDRVPTASEMDSKGRYSPTPAQARFGSWNEALRAAGFEPNHEMNLSDERLIGEIQRLTQELGHPPSTNDLKRDGKLSHQAYFRRYDDWASAVRAAGYEPRGWPTGPDNPRWSGGIASSINYGSNWRTQRTQALQRDSFTCQMPGCDFTRKSHCEQFGRDLHVHHIIPAATFCEADNPDYGEMNRVDNLVALCLQHHRDWEQMSPLKPDIRE